MKARVGWAAALIVAAVAPARAQLETSAAPGGGADSNWSATSGRTVGTNNGVFHAEAGWPGIGFTYLRGLDAVTDLGFHVGFNYGFEGTTNTAVGLNLAVPIRRTLSASGPTSIAVHASPGLSIYNNTDKDNRGALVGIGGPIGIVVGYKLDPRFTVDAGADFPVMLSFMNPTGLLFGPQFGVGAEYQVDRNVAVTLRSRFGPEFAIASGSSAAQLGFQTLIGVAYNAH